MNYYIQESLHIEIIKDLEGQTRIDQPLDRLSFASMKKKQIKSGTKSL